jgi:hypothetical protein
MGLFSDLLGTTKAIFQLGIGGVQIKNNSGTLDVKNAADNALAPIAASKVSVGDEVLEINSSAAGSGADWKYTLQVPTSGMTAAVTLTLPVDDGTANQVLATDGSGNLSWAATGSTLDCVHVNDTVLDWNSAATVALLTRPANAIVLMVEILIDTAFDGTAPNVSVGTAGTPAKYMASAQSNLKGTAKDRYVAHPGEATDGSTEAIIATFAAGVGASAGSARILVHYTTPS